MPDLTPSSRAERRRSTERRILDAARGLFAERGYERTTIRAVATSAGVDPALVMQYFGNKQELFRRSVHTPLDRSADGLETPADLLLATLGVKLAGLPETSLAMLRSMLTHPEAAEAVRAGLNTQIDEIAEAVAGEDARLRAALTVMLMVGVTIGHQLLDIEALRDASPERIAAVLRPAVQALIEP
ncbi:TetR/AcrR family transcriptional regulator [Microbispora oryzae]|uniref:TetR/AcrR family transcriptional regulator n=1 Tax=Microbispora oryzae TaxID=2806554 RepID=UPI0027DB07FE|nr:TetR family transcriptional regulator [Microbispora oryzae]